MKENSGFDLSQFIDKEDYFKDPIHKEINLKNNYWASELIFTKEFKRLKNINQLGIGFKVFPSANHSRFTHSVGAFQVALKFCMNLHQIPMHEKRIFLATALLHDIGHGPFSHVFEKISNISHEVITKKILLNKNGEIYKTLIKNKISPNLIISILDGSSKFTWMNKLISSNLDVDRIDYLLRDSYFIGTNYSTIDVDFLIERTHIIDNNVYFSKSTINVIESFLLGRYYMHKDIYTNKNSYVFEWALFEIFNRLKEIKNEFIKYKDKIYYYDLYYWLVDNKNNVFYLDKFIQFTDINFTSFINSLEIINDKILNSFIHGFIHEQGLYAFHYSKKDAILDEINKLNIDKNIFKYVYCEIDKKDKKIYYNDQKSKINIIDTKTNKKFEFFSQHLLNFKNIKKNNVDKLILINKNLLD